MDECSPNPARNGVETSRSAAPTLEDQRRLKFCLIRPPATESFRFTTTMVTPPLGLAYIGGALKQAGYPFTVIDTVAEAPTTHTKYLRGYLVGLRFDEILERIPADAAVVGITAVFTHEWPTVVTLIGRIKAAFPEKLVVVGGEHVTSMPEFCMATSQADFMVMGEGEETIVALARALECGADLSSVDGIVYRSGNEIRVNKRRVRCLEIDEIPWPAWEAFNLKTYHDQQFFFGMYSPYLTVPILATRGCPYQCTYCSAPNMWTPRWIPRDYRDVVDEIEYYVKTFGARNFPFQDLTAIVRKDWIVGFCQEILARGLDITWQLPAGTRSEAIDDEVAQLLYRSGMISMAYAPESGSETVRKLIKKKMHNDRLFESIRAAIKAKLNVACFMVIGFPHDRVEHLEETLPFVSRLADEGVEDMQVTFYMALPGTELFYQLYDAGKIVIDRKYFFHILAGSSIFPSVSYCAQLSLRQLLVWKLRLFFQFYGRKAKVQKGRGELTSLAKVLRGFLDIDHETKLQTAVRNGVKLAWHSVTACFGPRWIRRSEEKGLFDGWDAIYREIHERKIAAGARRPSVADAAQLHEHNVIDQIKEEHNTPRVFALTAAH
jgi:radical SAM superfamily enzyme YgiQ (UPF0313 family)